MADRSACKAAAPSLSAIAGSEESSHGVSRWGFRSYQTARVVRVLQQLQHLSKPLIVLDDGSYFLEVGS